MAWRGGVGVAILVAVLAGCGGGDGVVAAESGGSGAGSPVGSGAGVTPSPSGSSTDGPGDCAGSPGAVAPATPGRTPSPVDSDEGTVAPAGKAKPGTPATAEVVKARAGMDNTHTVTWDRADVISSKVVRIYFYGGVEPCSVLDSVKVEESGDSVRITLRAGSDPAKPDAMCIQIAKYKAVDVTLSEPVGDRMIVDGSAEDAQD